VEAHSQCFVSFQWRIENDVDTILDTYKPPKVLLDYLPSAILAGYDKEGDPIYLGENCFHGYIGLSSHAQYLS
jgi:hypothetical protein